MRKLQLDTLGIVLLWGIVLLALAAFSPTHAQEPAPYVCRTDYPTIRYEFRNIPQLWIDNGYWYVADGATMEGNTLIADAITEYPIDDSGIVVGDAVMGNSDYSVILHGDATTAPCDLPVKPIPVAPAPVYQSPAVVVSTNIVCMVQYPSLAVVCNG